MPVKLSVPRQDASKDKGVIGVTGIPVSWEKDMRTIRTTAAITIIAAACGCGYAIAFFVQRKGWAFSLLKSYTPVLTYKGNRHSAADERGAV